MYAALIFFIHYRLFSVSGLYFRYIQISGKLSEEKKPAINGKVVSSLTTLVL